MKSYERHGASIYKSRRWKALRWEAKRRDGFKCRECGARHDLEVDHIRPIRTHPDLTFDLSNLQTLCVACHARKTRAEIGLGDRDPAREAWRALVRETRRKTEQKGEIECSTA